MEDIKAPDLTREKIDKTQLQKWTATLNKYKAGKARLDARIISAENWWKLRNNSEAEKEGVQGRKSFSSRSAWLHNVIVSKHADAMKAFPEPNILPREMSDRQEARLLSSIVPCILEQNDFEERYSTAGWKKLKTGTGAYKVVWDPQKYNGLGDIAIYTCNLLNLFWESGVDNIQKSRYFFHTELQDTDLLLEDYPELEDKLTGAGGFRASKFDTDDTVSDDGKVTVIEVYYHKRKKGKRGEPGKRLLHYCKYVGETVLYCSEDDPECEETGFYAHGLFPYVLDPLFPIEGSPCGYGFVDICKNPQTAIDLMRAAVVRNTVAGATPRYFVRKDGQIKAEDLADLTKELIMVNGPIDEGNLRVVDYKPLPGTYIRALEEVIAELRETSGNTETATGSTNYGATAASAIAALQEASGKGSADATQASYRCFRQIVLLIIELIRQFYTVPRQFRIVGEQGEMKFVTYSNEGIQPQDQGVDYGTDMGYRVPEFDIKVEAAKKNAYSRLSQNELALQVYNNGMFNPQMADMAVMAIDMMEFEGKDEVLQKIAKNAQMFQRMQMAVQAAMALCQRYEPQNLQMLAGQLGMTQTPAQGADAVREGSVEGKRGDSEALTAAEGEDTRTRKARERAANVSLPEG